MNREVYLGDGVDLPPSPERIARLRKDSRGFPVPWFVTWFHRGKPTSSREPEAAPDFRVVSPEKMRRAFGLGLCWICGDSLGVHRVFAMGPMCVVNRVTMEPPSHRGCAEYAVQACPFMLRPRMRRNDKDMPEHLPIPGIHLDRNPGVTAVYETNRYQRFETGDGKLCKVGAPARVDWWAEGRPATFEQVMGAIDSGYPTLMKVAELEGGVAVAELIARRQMAERYLPERVPCQPADEQTIGRALLRAILSGER